MATALCQEPLVSSGFNNPVLDSQASFRAILDATAHPGRIVSVSAELNPPPPLSVASWATILTLCDHETPVWLDDAASVPDIAASLRFHCGAPLAEDRARAAFALCCGALPALEGFAHGTADYPERSATVICQVEGLGQGTGFILRGPGVDGMASFRVAGLPRDFISQWADNHALFPQGVDLVLTHGRQLSALPRSLAIEREA